MAPAPAHMRLRKPALLDLGDQTKDYFERRKSALRQIRQPFEQEWQEISDYIRIRRLRLYGDRVADQQRARKVINNHPTIASRICRGGMYSGLSSPSRPWLRFTTPDKDLAEFPKVKDALAKRADMVALIFQKSNFYPIIHESYGSLADFGNSCELIEDDFNNVIRLISYVTGTFLYALGESGNIDTVYREIDMQVSDMVDKFKGNVSPYVMQLYDRGEYNAMIPVVHAIEPNRHVIEGARGLPGRPFIEVYYEPQATFGSSGAPPDGMLSIGGYKLWPLMAGRWDIMDGSVYGHGCGLETIGDAQQLQTLEFRKAQLITKTAIPPMRMASSSKRAIVDHSAGGVTYYDPVQGPENVPSPAYMVNPQALPGIREEIAATEGRIDSAYFVDMFLMIMRMEGVQPRNEMEISERNGERFLQIGPVLDRLHIEKLNVAVARTYQRCEDAGIFAPLPREIEGQPLRVDYISILAQAQKAAGITGIEMVAGYVGRLAAIYPEVRHKLDAAQSVDEYADMVGVRPSIVRPDDTYNKMVDDEQKAQQAAAAASMGSSAADAAKVLSETPTSGKTALTDILSGGYTGGGGAG